MSDVGEREKIVFQENCTEPFAPSVRQILQTVTRDLRRHRSNQALKNDRKEYKKVGASTKALGRALGTVILPKHLSRAGDERHIIAAMIKDHINSSTYSAPMAQRLVYGDVDQLKRALVWAERHYGTLPR